MGGTRCHIKSIFSPAATQWHIVLAMSLHTNNNYAKKRGIGKKLLLTFRAVMLEEHVDLVAGDFKGAAWRRHCSNGNLSILEEAFADSDLPMPPGPTPLWCRGAVPGDWADVCGFLKLPDSYGRWKGRQHATFSIPHDALVLRPKDQICLHDVWLHLAFVYHHGDYEP